MRSEDSASSATPSSAAPSKSSLLLRSSSEEPVAAVSSRAAADPAPAAVDVSANPSLHDKLLSLHTQLDTQKDLLQEQKGDNFRLRRKLGRRGHSCGQKNALLRNVYAIVEAYSRQRRKKTLFSFFNCLGRVISGQCRKDLEEHSYR